MNVSVTENTEVSVVDMMGRVLKKVTINKDQNTEKGIEKGIEKRDIQTIQNCLKAQYSVKEISIITALSVQKINALIRKYKLVKM